MCVRSHRLTWRDLVDEYRQRLVRRAASPATIVTELRVLRGFTGFLAQRGCRQVPQLRPAHMSAFVLWLRSRRVPTGARRGQRWLPATVLVWANTTRRFLRWLARADHTLVDWSLWIAPVKTPRTMPRVLSLAEVQRLLAAAGGSAPRDLCDRAVLELLYASGVRVGELVGLNLADLDLCEGEVRVRQGKGRRERCVPIGAPAIRAVRAYLERGRGAQSVQRIAPAEPALFLSRRGTRLKVQTVEAMVRRRAFQARLAGRITPHTLRHTAAVHLLKGGADVRHIQEFLGHASVGTTTRYTPLALADLRQALARAHPRAQLRVMTRR